ncbi:hypothetical protein DICPUDRAFT_74957 [Dictyostelium purpureum]|uniref:Uncharacterized protein n=1 Tax=Dictyostelium purpureum TaxID=5786 RepID=F0Z983_DICPU|nr:uncharacterized protein DICPUDRAFT_74957 [Dictyostelium purpureum]EGC39537.1 hypothetical protein DICPUDRAFT_74957 [Dictyostelium purpureum]|eukprot:XP_003283984.1 hypothetical protein DICPUDRAFT_74957 [Dictyostelium purpureum]
MQSNTTFNIEELLLKIENVALKNIKNKESLDLLKILYKVCLNYRVKNLRSLTINSTFIDKLTSMLLDINTPFKIKILILSTISKISKNEPQLLYKNLKSFDSKTLPMLLSLLLTNATHSQLFIQNIPVLVQSISTQDPLLRWSSMPSLAIAARYHSDLLTTSHTKPIETQLIQFLTHASLISDQKQSSTGFFGKIANTAATPVTELDGSISIEFFTVLNNSASYTEDQTFNIYSFSILYTWLKNLYKPLIVNEKSSSTNTNNNNEEDDQPQTQPMSSTPPQQYLPIQLQNQRNLNQPFHNAVVSYCLRIIDQLKFKPLNSDQTGNQNNQINLGGGIGNKDQDNLPVIALLEAVRILDYLCCLDNNLFAKIFPTVQKAYQLHLPSSKSTNAHSGHVLLALLQFFVNHSHTLVYDPEPLFKAYFQTYLPRTYMNSFVSFETLNFCLKNKEILLKNSNVFNLYFPPIFKCLAWFPQSYVFEFSELLPSLIAPHSFIEVFHLLLDLPLLTLSMESVLVEQRKFASMGIEHSDVVDTAWSEYRVLYNYLLRNESGVNINFWSTTTLPLLQQFCKKNPVTPRSIGSCDLVPSLLNIYFDVLLEYGNLQIFIQLLPVIFERIDQLFLYEPYQKKVRENLMSHVLAIFKRYPSLIVSEKDLIIQVVSEARMHYRDIVTLSLCFIIGEYTSPFLCGLNNVSSQIFSEYHETLELITYEKINTIKMDSTMNNNSNSNNFSSNTNNLNYLNILNINSNNNNNNLNSGMDVNQLQQQYNINIMLILMSSLTKIASRWPDATSRVVLCLMKIVGYHQYFDPQVIQRANECISLLKYPSFAAALYNCDQPQDEIFHSTISNQTIGITIQDCNSSLSFLLQDTLNFKSTKNNSIHPYILK